MIEHLPKPVTCTGSHVLGLVLNALGTYLPLMRLAADKQRFRCVTQSISLSNIYAFALLRRPNPEAHETCSPRQFGSRRTCFWVAVTLVHGGDPETANEACRSRLCSLARDQRALAPCNGFGGADRDRTGDLMLAKHALSQLSYSPTLAASFQPLATSCLLRATKASVRLTASS